MIGRGISGGGIGVGIVCAGPRRVVGHGAEDGDGDGACRAARRVWEWVVRRGALCGGHQGDGEGGFAAVGGQSRSRRAQSHARDMMDAGQQSRDNRRAGRTEMVGCAVVLRIAAEGERQRAQRHILRQRESEPLHARSMQRERERLT